MAESDSLYIATTAMNIFWLLSRVAEKDPKRGES
jgi:hypothetical protein